MPRDGSGVYSKAGTSFSPNTKIVSASVNSQIDDLATDQNTARPIVAGGTGATTASGARINLLGVSTVTDNALVRFHTNAGLMQNSSAILSDDGSLALTTTTTNGLSQTNNVPASASRLDLFNDGGVGFHAAAYGSAYAGASFFSVGAGGIAIAADNPFSFGTTGNFDVKFYANSNYVGRFTSGSRYFLVGATNSAFATVEAGVLVDPSGAITLKKSGTGSNTHAIFANNAASTPTQVGSITTSGSATTFNTSSDQRLKENFQDFDSGTIIDAISVYRYQWRIDGSTGYGPKAQELANVFPQAVTEGNGEPGDPDFVPWSYDAGKLVPVLLRELQHLRARVAILEGGA